ncbi:MAG: YdeI/OmpD-associated family protein [Acidobacteriota bacterium]
MEPTYFATQKDFRKWLEKNHQKADELLVGFWKLGSNKPSMTWSESVDQALCFGWIDGVRRKVDEEAYTIRFTPRRPKSIWSRINIDKVERLTKEGLMQPAGLAAYDKKEDHRAVIYAYENRPKEFDPKYEKAFRKQKKAWAFFEKQPAGYRRLMIHHVMSAKQEATRQSRLEKLIAFSIEEKRL